MVIGLISGAYLLKRYDFSYKKNFWLIAGGFVLAIVISGMLIDILGLDKIWSRRGPMRRFYQKNQQLPNRYRKGGRGEGG